MKKWVCGALGLAAACAAAGGREAQSLAGTWRFALDAEGTGAREEWYRRDLEDTIRLPGTTEENGKGPLNARTHFTRHLSRVRAFCGPAWYQRDIEIPAAWAGRRIVLFIERTKHTTVWLDGRLLGRCDRLATPHEYELGDVVPGRHRLTVCVDNGRRWPVSGGHHLSDDTQTNWNGLLGRLELRADEPVWIEHVQVLPDAVTGRIRLRTTLGNRRGVPVPGTLSFRVWRESILGRFRSEARGQVSFTNATDGAAVEAEILLPAEAARWDEFRPDRHRVEVSLVADLAGRTLEDRVEIPWGLRDFRARGTQFTINGRPTFLRGKHDACVFPLTGYPPMEVEGWLRYFRVLKDYGLNHCRFHSWCPPEAAFEAADRTGVYLQPEGANFGDDLSKNAEAARFTREEGLRILRAYGHHPSFVMFALGNEMGGGREACAAIVRELRAADPSRLYAQASNYDFGDPRRAEGDDYWTTFRTRTGGEGNVRGSYSHADLPLGHIQAGPPSTDVDYRAALAGVPVPVIGHEVGQYQVYPDFREISKYSGVTRAWNLEVFRDRLAAAGMADRAHDFFRASGALAAVCCREEVEAALRTSGFGGFQLLDLQDFPGQGTALVGLLNAFMESKGIVKPAVWRGFCGETAPLARLKRRSWTTGEALEAEVEVAHYGPAAMPGAAVDWALAPATGGRRIAAGRLEPVNLACGGVTHAGTLSVPLAAAPAPAACVLELRIPGTRFRNRYDVWVYPAWVEMRPADTVRIARALDADARAHLAGGGRVVLFPKPEALARHVEGFFASDFWCYPMFRGICERTGKPVAPGTLGLVCDPGHPALARFPTDFHSDWQWWPVVMNSRAIILDGAPFALKPIVQVIDNFERNHRLALVFEAQVGPGRLLICGADLPSLADSPEARQLYASLVTYAGSPAFQPAVALSEEQVRAILDGPAGR